MAQRSFSWPVSFKTILIVDQELFHNTYNIRLFLRPTVSDVSEQSLFFERAKFLFEQVFENTIVTNRGNSLFNTLKHQTVNRFVELPSSHPVDQIMATVCFTKINAVLEGKIFVDKLELSSYQGDGITYTIEKDSPELALLDVDKWFTEKYNKFDPWWLRPDTATYDAELPKGIYTGNYSWHPLQQSTKRIDKEQGEHAKIYKFTPRILDGDKGDKK
jgi:hypothetical protein